MNGTAAAILTQAIFFLAALMIGYTLAGYGGLIWLRQRLLCRRRLRREVAGRARAISRPEKVSVIIAVHNGEALIAAKIADCLRLDWPRDSLEILVADDGSTDGTVALVRAMADPRVHLVSGSKREGKEAAQRRAVAVASGEILVFTDAGVQVAPDSLQRLLAHFMDPEIGCVSGVDRTLDPVAWRRRRVAGESVFVSYDTWLKRQESLGGSCVGNSGWLFAVRRTLCEDWQTRLPSDFATALGVVRAGFRAILEPGAVATGEALASDHAELRRKVRTMVRGMTALAACRDLLNPLRYGFFAVQLFSHKVLRWLLPAPILALFISSALLQDVSAFYRAVFLVQVAVLFLGIVTSRFRLARFLVVTNLATLLAWWQFLRGRRYLVWEPSARRLRDG